MHKGKHELRNGKSYRSLSDLSTLTRPKVLTVGFLVHWPVIEYTDFADHFPQITDPLLTIEIDGVATLSTDFTRLIVMYALLVFAGESHILLNSCHLFF